MQNNDIYNQNGYLIVDDFISKEKANELLKDLTLVSNGSKKAFKNAKNHLRFCSLELSDSLLLKNLVSDTRMQTFVSSLIDIPFYLYQIKVNPNNPQLKSNYHWHQDYYYWHHLDGMKECNAVNIALLLEGVTLDNGPTVFIPSSHQAGFYPHREATNPEELDNLGKKLPYIIPDEWVNAHFDVNHFAPAIGEAGTLVAFNPNLLHKALDNTSSSNRIVLFLTFVSSMVPFEDKKVQRPLWLANKNNELNLPLWPDASPLHYQLCQLTERDMMDVKNIGLEAQEEMNPHYYQPDDEIIRLALKSGLSFGMKVSDQIVAFFLLCPDYKHDNILSLLPDYENLLYIPGVMVKKPFRQKGIAYQIAKESVSQIMCSHFDLIWTTVSTANHPSNALFKKLGFISVGERKVYDDEVDKFVIVKKLK